MATRTCGKCGEPGHNARTCGKAPKAKAAVGKPVGARTGARGRSGKHVVTAGVPVLPGGSVIEQLEARADGLREQIKSVDQLQKELEIVEKVLKDLRSIKGAA